MRPPAADARVGADAAPFGRAAASTRVDWAPWLGPATAMFDHVFPPRPWLSAMSFIYVRNTVTMMPMKNKGKEQLLMYIYIYVHIYILGVYEGQ